MHPVIWYFNEGNLSCVLLSLHSNEVRADFLCFIKSWTCQIFWDPSCLQECPSTEIKKLCWDQLRQLSDVHLLEILEGENKMHTVLISCSLWLSLSITITIWRTTDFVVSEGKKFTVTAAPEEKNSTDGQYVQCFPVSWISRRQSHAI